jgi:hypothetical protein
MRNWIALISIILVSRRNNLVAQHSKYGTTFRPAGGASFPACRICGGSTDVRKNSRHARRTAHGIVGVRPVLFLREHVGAFADRKTENPANQPKPD